MSAALGLSYVTPPMTSSPLVPGPLEDKENHPPVEVIDLTGDSEDKEEVPDRAEDSGQLIPIEERENILPIPVAPPASERLPYTTTTGERCVCSSGPIRSSPTPDTYPQVVQRLRHEPYQGTRLLSGTWILHAFQTFNSTRLTIFSLHDLRL